MARALRRLLPHEYLELNDYMRMISRYPVMDHVEFDRRVRAFLPVQRELIELEKELEPYRENDEDPPPELYQRYRRSCSAGIACASHWSAEISVSRSPLCIHMSDGDCPSWI